ncbi:cyclin-K [Bacillus rossius redtenbacheri]|uniref:cyclin-K n=1 Tax=Bacillus rossius redtenbacheri TaxID=93214 RepID=UPI002FDEF8A1
MPCWYYEKKELRNTPSIVDGIDYDTECRYRREGARFIIESGTKMDLGYNTVATGVVYFHRFYMFHSFHNFPRYVTACCCLFLAGKVEETPKKCKDVIKTARMLLTDQKFGTFGEDPKEEVMTLERILLQTIKFDLQVEHPYKYLLTYAKSLRGDKNKLQKMVQMAWTFVNDSLCTTLSLQWEPEVIAVALMYLAGKLSKFEVVDWEGRTSRHLRWWDKFVEDVTMDLLEDICHQVLDLYSQPQAAMPDSPPLQPTVQSPSMKKERLPRPISPAQQHSLSPVASAIPVKVTKGDRSHPLAGNGESSEDKKDATKPGEGHHYQYPSTYAHTPTFGHGYQYSSSSQYYSGGGSRDYYGGPGPS